MDSINLVAFTGYAGSGKDEAAKALIQKGWDRKAFADPIKRLVATQHSLTVEEVEALKDRDYWRRSLQVTSDHLKATFGAYFWVDMLFNEPHNGRLVVPDCRFAYEALEVRGRGGRVIRIDRPGVGPRNEHVSEVGVDAFKPDVLIINDGTIEDLHRKVFAAVFDGEGRA